MKTLYRCSYCKFTKSSMQDVIEHEIECDYNPKNKRCTICEYNTNGERCNKTNVYIKEVYSATSTPNVYHCPGFYSTCEHWTLSLKYEIKMNILTLRGN